MERFNLKKLNDMEVNELYQVKVSNSFAAFQNLDDDDDTMTAEKATGDR
jgi:hypothetical protein